MGFYVELNATIGVNFQTNVHEHVADRRFVYYFSRFYYTDSPAILAQPEA